MRDLIAAPSAFLAYTRSGASATDLLVFGGASLVIVAMGLAAVSRVWREEPVLHRAVFNLLLGTALLWAFRDSPTHNDTIRVLMSEHSIPVAKYMYRFAALFDSSRIELVEPFIPVQSAALNAPIVPKAHHVLLIIAECLRADRLPSYGYIRPTTPFIQSEGSKWLVLERAYSHGAATAENFPVLFNSQYFAAITGSNEGAAAFWRFLRDRGIGSAFLSSGAMEWGGVTHSIGFEFANHTFIASSIDQPESWRTTDRRFDYAVDDAYPLRRYVELLQHDFAGHASFAALHFVGSHYPFRYDDTPDVFVPSMRNPGAADPEVRGDATANISAATIARISNSFDNSLVHIDGLVRQCVEALERLGIAEDSVVIVTSDHGESLGEHNTFFHGTTLYDEQVRVPLLVRVGKNLARVRTLFEARRSGIVGQVDLLPTILHLLSGSVPSGVPFDGVSLLAGSRKRYELLLYRGVGEKVAIVTEDRKYIFDLQGQRAEEYDLPNDPGELRNVWTGSARSIGQFTGALLKRGVLSERSFQ